MTDETPNKIFTITPIKQLPFSPSQFLNTTNMLISFESNLQSTPEKHKSPVLKIKVSLNI